MAEVRRPGSRSDIGDSPVPTRLRWPRSRGKARSRGRERSALRTFKRGKLVERELWHVVVDGVGRFVQLLRLIDTSVDDLRGRLARRVPNLDVDGDDSGLRASLTRARVGLFALVGDNVSRQRRPTWLTMCKWPCIWPCIWLCIWPDPQACASTPRGLSCARQPIAETR